MAKGASFSMTNSMIANRMSSTVFNPHTKETRVASIEISHETLLKLNEIKKLVGQAFAPTEADAINRINRHFRLTPKPPGQHSED